VTRVSEDGRQGEPGSGAAERPAGSARRTFAATVLVLEAAVVLFAALVAYGLRLAEPAAIAVGAGLVAVAALLAAGLLRTAAGYVLGSAVQLWLVATGLVVPAMYWLGGLFALLWVVGLRLGGRIDRERAERLAGAG
jgi:hypothetical protein